MKRWSKKRKIIISGLSACVITIGAVAGTTGLVLGIDKINNRALKRKLESWEESALSDTLDNIYKNNSSKGAMSGYGFENFTLKPVYIGQADEVNFNKHSKSYSDIVTDVFFSYETGKFYELTNYF